MRINNNIMAMNTHRQYGINNDNMAKATEKLSSGYRINSAGDDAAGLAISEKMRAQIRGLNMASKNSEDAISLVQTAEGALTETQAILQRMRELAVQSASDTNEDTVDRVALQAEYAQLISEIDDIADDTKFNDMSLLDGSFGATTAVDGTNSDIQVGLLGVSDMKFEGFAAGTHTISFSNGGNAGDPYTATLGTTVIGSVTNADGANVLNIDFGGGQKVSIQLAATAVEDGLDGQDLVFTVSNAAGEIQTGANQNQTMDIAIADMSAGTTGLNVAGSSVGTKVNAQNAITTVNTAINTVSAERAKLGAMQNRLDHKINNLDTSSENLSAAESRIRDVDMAAEMTQYTQTSILVQAATSMLAQANSAPQSVLKLLG